VKVELRSEAYGSEFYEYETLEKAIAGAGRRARSCFDQYAGDGVERAIIIHIDAYSDEPGWKPSV